MLGRIKGALSKGRGTLLGVVTVIYNYGRTEVSQWAVKMEKKKWMGEVLRR